MDIPVYFYANAFAVVVWWCCKKRFADKEITMAGYYLLFTFFTESAAWCYSFFLYTSNHWIYNLYTTIQVVLLCLIYKKIIVKPSLKKIIHWAAIGYPVIVILDFLFFQSFLKFHTQSYILGCILIIILAFSYFNQLLHLPVYTSLKRNPFFWFNIGNIIFFCSSIFYMGSINFIIEKRIDDYGDLITYFVYSFTSVQYLFFIIAFLCNLKREPK